MGKPKDWWEWLRAPPSWVVAMSGKLDTLIGLAQASATKEEHEMALIDDVIGKVEALTGVVDSAEALLTTLHDLLVAAGTDPVKLQQVADLIDKNKDELAAAVAANTPGAE